MALEAMIVSRDWQEVSVLECILNSLHVLVSIEADIEQARQKISKSKLDALIVDRDLTGTERLLGDVPPHNSSVPLLLLSRSAEQTNLAASGATFFFEKPVSVEQAVRTLSATRNLMLNSRLRYHRQTIDVPVFLSFGKRKRVTAQLTNLSNGGMAVCAEQVLQAHSPVNVRFRLPGVNCSVHAKGELAWADPRGHAGIKFVEIPVQLQRRMQIWLEKTYFTN